MMLTIADVKKIEPNSKDVPVCPTVKAMVLDVSAIEQGDGNMKAKFYVVLADATDSITATVYNEKEHTKFVKGFAVVIMNVLLKQSYIYIYGVTSRSDVAMAKPFSIPEDVESKAPALPGTQSMDLQTALHSPVKTITTVKGKITKVSPATTKPVDGNNVPFQEVILKDRSARATLAIWEDMVNTLSVGQMVKVTKCRVRLWEDEKKLGTTKASTCEVVNADEDLDDVSSDEDKDDDPGQTSMPTGSIVGVFEVDPYLSCPKSSCNNKKLVTIKPEDTFIMLCQNCNGNYRGSSSNVYLRATVLLMDDNNMTKKVTIFAPQLKKLLESRGMDSTIVFDQSKMMEKIFQIIPMNIKYLLANNTIREVHAACKRHMPS